MFKKDRSHLIETKMLRAKNLMVEREPDFAVAIRVYRKMRVCMKISFHAWEKKQTVKQLFFQTIYDHYFQMTTNVSEIINLDYIHK